VEHRVILDLIMAGIGKTLLGIGARWWRSPVRRAYREGSPWHQVPSEIPAVARPRRGRTSFPAANRPGDRSFELDQLGAFGDLFADGSIGLQADFDTTV
jgi:hypothetical protein